MLACPGHSLPRKVALPVECCLVQGDQNTPITRQQIEAQELGPQGGLRWQHRGSSRPGRGSYKEGDSTSTNAGPGREGQSHTFPHDRIWTGLLGGDWS